MKKGNKPLEFWFQESNEGLILFIVFYTLKCRWGKCAGCNLPDEMANEMIDSSFVNRQINYVFLNPKVREKHDDIKKVIVSNNGSVMDKHTFPKDSLTYLIRSIKKYLKNIKTLSIETRVEYISANKMWNLYQLIDKDFNVEIAVGFEAFDSKIRNKYLKKGVSLKNFNEAVKMLALFGYKLKCYFRLKPTAQVSSSSAILDIHRGMDLLDQYAREYGLKINMHLNPTYVARGTSLEKDYQKGKFHPPSYLDVLRAARYGKNKKINLYIGIYDEGLALKGGTFAKHPDEIDNLEKFNKTMDYSILDREHDLEWWRDVHNRYF